MRILTIFGIIVFISFQSFGQEVIGYGIVPKGFNELKNPTLPDFKKFSIEKNGGLTIRPEGYTYARADPRMPIAVPPRDLFSKFPIKEIPKDYPSDMPIKKLEEDLRGFINNN